MIERAVKPTHRRVVNLAHRVTFGADHNISIKNLEQFDETLNMGRMKIAASVNKGHNFTASMLNTILQSIALAVIPWIAKDSDLSRPYLASLLSGMVSTAITND